LFELPSQVDNTLTVVSYTLTSDMQLFCGLCCYALLLSLIDDDSLTTREAVVDLPMFDVWLTLCLPHNRLLSSAMKQHTPDSTSSVAACIHIHADEASHNDVNQYTAVCLSPVLNALRLSC